jgi:acyl carrier protein
MTETTETTIRALLSEVKDGLDYSTISVDTEFGNAGFDSLDVASLLLAVQEHFHLEISDEDAEQLNTIAQLRDYIAAHKPT